MESNPSTPRLEDLLAHATWVAALARRLVADPERAEDAVQDTWLAALRRPPERSGRPEAARAWLANVLRNAVRQRGRSETARRRRELAVAGAEGVSRPAADLVQRAQLRRLLVEEVLALDEPYRRTILRCFFEGESAADVARSEGISGSTVRNRLARGLALLRARLDERFDGDSRSWLRALAPFAAPGPASGSGLGFRSLETLRWLVMSAGAKAGVVGCVLVLAAGFWWLRSGERVRGATESATPPAVAVGEPARVARRVSAGERIPATREVPRDATAPSAAAAERAASTTLAPGTLEVAVRRGERAVTRGVAHLGAAGSAWLPRDPSGSVSEEVRRRDLDSAGTARFERLDPGRYTVGVEAEHGDLEQAFVTLEADEGRRLEFILGEASVHGTVYDASGGPVAGARIQIERVDGPRPVASTIVWSDERGAYRVRDLTAGRFRIALDRSGWQDAQASDYMGQITLEEGEQRRFDFGNPRGLFFWSGSVLSALGTPLTGDGVLHFQSDVDGSYFNASYAAGSFSIPVPPGRYAIDVSLSANPERRRVHDSLRLGDQDVERDVVVPGAVLQGRAVLRSSGAAPAVATLQGLHLGLRRRGHDYPAAVHTPTIDAPGSFRFECLDEGTWILTGRGIVPAEQEVVVRREDAELWVTIEIP